jgi:hypothetical protein
MSSDDMLRNHALSERRRKAWKEANFKVYENWKRKMYGENIDFRDIRLVRGWKSLSASTPPAGVNRIVVGQHWNFFYKIPQRENVAYYQLSEIALKLLLM